MPQAGFYRDLKLGDQLRRLAEHHGGTRARHLSVFEQQLIEHAADHLIYNPTFDPPKEDDQP